MKMKKFSLLLAVVLIFETLICQVPTFANEEAKQVFYVATDGNDANNGTIDAPFATLQGARDAIRKYKEENGVPQGGITVYVRGGEYIMTETIQLEQQDSGASVDSPIRYKAYPGEKPVFQGGVKVMGKDFTKVTDEKVLSRFPSDDARKNVMQYNLKENGITDYGVITDAGSGVGWATHQPGRKEYDRYPAPMQVFMDDKYMWPARYPNFDEDDDDKGWLLIGNVLDDGAMARFAQNPRPTFEYDDERIEKWASYDDIWLRGVVGYHYFMSSVKVASVDKVNNVIKCALPVDPNIKKGRRYYLFNILDELDAPGESYIDRNNGILYLYPFKNMKDSVVKLSVFSEQAMVNCQDVSFVNFQGLTFENTRHSGFIVEGGDSVLIDCCTIRNVGVEGVWLGYTYHLEGKIGYNWWRKPFKDISIWNNEVWDGLENGKNHRVTNCDIYNLGYGGVWAKGGDPWNLESSGMEVSNCRIRNYGNVNGSYESAGIRYNGHGFIFKNNQVSEAPCHAMLGEATDLFIENNEMYDVIRYFSDAGAVYTNYMWPLHSVHINNNYIHGFQRSTYNGHFTHWDGNVPMRAGIYTDSDQFYAEVKGNVIVGAGVGYWNSGKAGQVSDNVFIDCQLVYGNLIFESYSWGWPVKDFLDLPEFHAVGSWPYLMSEKWREAYPEFYAWLDKAMEHDNLGNTMDDLQRNIMVFNGHHDWYLYNQPERRLKWNDGDEYVWIDNVLTEEDPGFVDMENGDYNLREDAPVFDMIPDFKRYHLKDMGLKTGVVGADLYASVSLAIGSSNAIAGGQKVKVDSDNADVKPVIKNSRTLVPVRFVTENLGAQVDWDEASKKVTINTGDKKVELVIGDKNITVDGVKTPMDVSAEIIEGRTMLPLRALVEVGMDKEVFWDDKGLIVISSEENILLNHKYAVDRMLDFIKE